MGYRNYQSFIDKLGQAMQGQQKAILEAWKKVDDQRKAWQECERKRASYETLATRAKQAIQRQENKREQKENDEFAMRRAQRRRR